MRTNQDVVEAGSRPRLLSSEVNYGQVVAQSCKGVKAG
jgi:hypothetical protein